MIKRILVPQDGSTYGRASLDCALWLARGFKASLTGIHVVDVVALEGPFLHDISGSLGFEPFLNFSTRMREILESNGKAILSSFEETCAREGITHEVILSSGIVTNEICEKAKLSDLVVLGRKGVNARFEHGLLGSVAEGVIRKSPKPVMIVAEEFTPPINPLLAYDGSPSASKAMHSAAIFSKTLGLPLTVLTVTKGEKGGSILKDAENYLKPYEVNARFVSIADDPPLSIEKYYKEKKHDLLFMGTSHHSRIYELVLGSTTEHVMRAVDGPVFLER